MNEFCRLYLDRLRAGTMGRFKKELLIIAAISVAVTAMAAYSHANFVMFMVMLIIPVVLMLTPVLMKMKSDDPQTVLCLSDSTKELFAGMMRIFSVRAVAEVLLGVSLLVVLHCAVSGLDIGVSDVALLLSFLASMPAAWTLIWVLQFRSKTGTASMFQMAYMLAAIAIFTLISFADPYVSVAAFLVLAAVLSCVLLYLLKTWTFGKEDFFRGCM